jgi:hypothetical protein
VLSPRPTMPRCTRHPCPLATCPWAQIMAVILNAPFHATKAALPAMIDAGWGRVINTGAQRLRAAAGPDEEVAALQKQQPRSHSSQEHAVGSASALVAVGGKLSLLLLLLLLLLPPPITLAPSCRCRCLQAPCTPWWPLPSRAHTTQPSTGWPGSPRQRPWRCASWQGGGAGWGGMLSMAAVRSAAAGAPPGSCRSNFFIFYFFGCG